MMTTAPRTGRAAFPASSAVLITHPRDRDRILLVHHAGADTHVLPGGKAHWDESPRETAAREAGEELGIPVTVGPLLVLNWLSPAFAHASGPAGDSKSGYPCLLSTFAASIRAADADRIQVPALELHGYAWWSIEEARRDTRAHPEVLRNAAAALAAHMEGRGAIYLET